MEQLFNQFHKSVDFLEILNLFEALCSEVGVDYNIQGGNFYTIVREKLTAWRTRSLYPSGVPRRGPGGACAPPDNPDHYYLRGLL